jgi:hypothetical protein
MISISLIRANVNILYINNDQILWPYDYTPRLGKVLTKLQLSQSREADPLIYNIMIHKKSF